MNAKKILLARVAERVSVKGGKSNLIAEVKTWFLIVLSATLYVQVLKVEETVCGFLKNGVACLKSSLI